MSFCGACGTRNVDGSEGIGVQSLAVYSAASETARFFTGRQDREFRILRHGEGCSRLWRAVIRLALKDLRFARRFEGRRRIERHVAITTADKDGTSECAPVAMLHQPSPGRRSRCRPR